MAALRRLGGDAVGLGAAGIVSGTALAALGSSAYVVMALAALALLTRLRWRLLLAGLTVAAFAIAGMRGVGQRAAIFDPFAGVRDALLAPLVAAVPGNAGALAAGLTLGDAKYFTPKFRAAMKTSATTHLVALSGFNVALMLGFARRLLRGRVGRRTEIASGIALLVGFVLIAGFQPSLLRAALMGTVLLLGEYAGRRVASGRLLVLAAAAILLYDPRLITHLGFVLSFISSWALLATVSDMEAMLVRGRRLRAFSGYVLPSLIAQLGVAPALLASVGSVMLVGLAVNPVLIPLTPCLTALAGIELMLSHVAQGLAAMTSPVVTLISLPVTAGIALAARIPLEISFALPAGLVAAFYAVWIGWTIARKPALW